MASKRISTCVSFYPKDRELLDKLREKLGIHSTSDTLVYCMKRVFDNLK